jgi:hypothetical protein
MDVVFSGKWEFSLQLGKSGQKKGGVEGGRGAKGWNWNRSVQWTFPPRLLFYFRFPVVFSAGLGLPSRLFGAVGLTN